MTLLYKTAKIARFELKLICSSFDNYIHILNLFGKTRKAFKNKKHDEYRNVDEYIVDIEFLNLKLCIL